MPKPFDRERRYWLATALLLSAGLAGWSAGIAAAIGLTAARLAQFALRERSFASLAVQVRALYLALLVLGVWPPLAFLHLAQAAGVWASVLFDYCLAARVLSLMPWNRRAPLSARLLAWTFLAPPARGSIVERARAAMVYPPAALCSKEPPEPRKVARGATREAKDGGSSTRTHPCRPGSITASAEPPRAWTRRSPSDGVSRTPME